MAQVPPLTSAAEQRAIDRALAMALSEDREGALRIVVALLEDEPLSVFNTFVCAWLLGGLGRKQELELGMRAALERAVFEGNLPLAIAAHGLLRDAELVDDSQLEAIAAAFAKGSSRLSDKRGAPPQMAAAPKESPALGEDISGDALLERAAKSLHAAKTAQ